MLCEIRTPLEDRSTMEPITLQKRLDSLKELDIGTLREIARGARRHEGDLREIHTGEVNLFWRIDTTQFHPGALRFTEDDDVEFGASRLHSALVEDPETSDLAPVNIELTEQGVVTQVVLV